MTRQTPLIIQELANAALRTDFTASEGVLVCVGGSWISGDVVPPYPYGKKAQEEFALIADKPIPANIRTGMQTNIEYQQQYDTYTEEQRTTQAEVLYLKNAKVREGDEWKTLVGDGPLAIRLDAIQAVAPLLLRSPDADDTWAFSDALPSNERW